LPKTNWR